MATTQKPYVAATLLVNGKVVRRSSDVESLRRQATAIRAVNRKRGKKGVSVRVLKGNP